MRKGHKTIFIIINALIIIFIAVIECGDMQEEDSSTHCPDFALTVDREQQCLVRMERNVMFAKQEEGEEENPNNCCTHLTETFEICDS